MRRQREPVSEQSVRDQVIEILHAGVVRRDEVAGRLGVADDVAHRVLRNLTTEDRIHSDGRYWILGSRR